MHYSKQQVINFIMMLIFSRCNVSCNKYYINITFLDWVIVENIIPSNVITNRGDDFQISPNHGK